MSGSFIGIISVSSQHTSLLTVQYRINMTSNQENTILHCILVLTHVNSWRLYIVSCHSVNCMHVCTCMSICIHACMYVAIVDFSKFTKAPFKYLSNSSKIRAETGAV